MKKDEFNPYNVPEDEFIDVEIWDDDARKLIPRKIIFFPIEEYDTYLPFLDDQGYYELFGPDTFLVFIDPAELKKKALEESKTNKSTNKSAGVKRKTVKQIRKMIVEITKNHNKIYNEYLEEKKAKSNLGEK